MLSHCTELADHTAPDDEMWAAMKESGAAVASTPLDEMGMAHGNPVAFEAVERGVKCGLGAVSAPPPPLLLGRRLLTRGIATGLHVD